jgi:hypothetical protein
MPSFFDLLFTLQKRKEKGNNEDKVFASKITEPCCMVQGKWTYAGLKILR